jgi:thiol:disulfide interchange protein/DsbC/DsbD-like thiol-disulfide interchange protein
MKTFRAIPVAIAAITALLTPLANAASAAPVKTGHVEAELLSQTTGAAPGSTLYVALRQKIMPGWHTYWRNPGDAGQATSLTWTLPAGWAAGDIVWPAPERYIAGPLMNYVFSDEVYLPIPITLPAGAKPGETVTLKAAVDWLVCKDVCIPEDATLTLDVPVVASPVSDPQNSKAITDTLAMAPKAAGLKATFNADAAAVKLSITGDAVKGEDVSHAYFFPYNGAVIEQIKPQSAERGPEGLTMILAPGYDFQHGKPPATLDGVIYFSPGHAYEVSATSGAALPGAAGTTPPVITTDAGKGGGTSSTGVPADGNGANLGLPAAIAFALLGGLILNLMPCVFPVLSMKAAALARHVEAPSRARAEGVAFLVGCVLTFVVLAAVLIAAQKAGQAVGWGFQLQYPGMVVVLALIMLGVGLNLSGVFEIGLSAQGVGQGLAGRSDMIGAFFTGVLAVVVAAPCTAPLMAPAIGWALIQPPVAALCVFAALGVGLALPFAAVSFVPALFKLLPRPGAWMDVFRKVLAFPMYAAAAWLVWVFALEAGDAALPFLFAAAVVLAFSAFLWGLSQHARKPWLTRTLAAVALIGVIPLSVIGAGMSAAPAVAGAATTSSSPVAGVPTEPWSPEKVASLRAEGKPVFVDFTAAWCVTCQVNERTALATQAVADAFKKTGAVYLKADWTNRNADIAKALAAEGRSGVPLYLLYDAKGGGDPKILPQLLTSGAVVEALNAAAKPA